MSNDCKYRSHSASTVLIQQVPFSGLYFVEQVPSLQIGITVLFSADLQTPRIALPGFPTTLPVFQKVSTQFFLPCAHTVDASFTRCRLNRRKLNTYREARPPSSENGTWQVPFQLSHSAFWHNLPNDSRCDATWIYSTMNRQRDLKNSWCSDIIGHQSSNVTRNY